MTSSIQLRFAFETDIQSNQTYFLLFFFCVEVQCDSKNFSEDWFDKKTQFAFDVEWSFWEWNTVPRTSFEPASQYSYPQMNLLTLVYFKLTILSFFYNTVYSKPAQQVFCSQKIKVLFYDFVILKEIYQL
jgi:hypothetical protein